VLAVAVHLVFAQLTLVLAIAAYLTGKATRWRPSWLLGPAIAGAAWTLAVGPGAAVAGFFAGPARVLGYLTASGHQFGHVLHFGAAFSGAGGWLPRQLPLAILTGTAEAAVASWLSWLHTDEWDVPEPRPGLLVAVRRLTATRRIRAGGVVTRDGACLGVTPGSGARVTLAWREVAGGVLACGGGPADALTTSFQVVHAALRRRKPVLAVDLTGDPVLPRQFAAACAAAGVPLQVFGAAAGTLAGGQPACYEPFRHGTPAYRAALVTGMLSWDGPRSQHRRSCVAYLEDVFELLDAAPGDPRVPVLDEVLHLLNPLALRARARHVPAGYGRRTVLAERTGVSASLIDAEPATTADLAQALRLLRASQTGRWLRQPVGGQFAPVDLGRTVSGRGAVLFCLADPEPDVRAMLARLICRDVLALGARLRGAGLDGDGIVWLTGCEAVDEGTLAALIAAGPATGLPVVATASSARAAGAVAEYPNTLLLHRVADPAAATRLAAVAAPRFGTPRSGASAPPAAPAPGQPGLVLPAAVSADDLGSLGHDEFLLSVASPRRLVRRALAVRARERL
jgi:hypothetical protein